MSRILYVFIIVFAAVTYASGQQEDLRKSEDDIRIEDKFVHARLLMASGKKADAIKMLDTLRRSSPPSAAILFELAKLHHEAKDLNQTENHLKSALKLEPDNYWIRKFEIDFNKELGRYDLALSSAKHLMAVYPLRPDIYDEAVSLCIKANDLPGALNILDQKEKNLGWSDGIYLKKAEILDNAGKIDEAVAVLNTLAGKYPGQVKYLRLIAKMLHSNDRVADAEPYLRKIVELDPDDADARLGLMLIKGKSESRQDFFAGLSPMISNPDAPIELKVKELMPYVEKHATAGDTLLGRQLITLCDKLVIAHPGDARAHALYGDVLKNNGEHTAAIRQYEKTLKLNNKNFLVWEQLMISLEKTGNFEQLTAISAQAMDFFPNQAVSYYFAARCLVEKKEYKKAIDLLDEASMISASNPYVMSKVSYAQALIEYRKNNLALAMEALTRSLEISKNQNAEAMELRGDIFRDKNNMAEAVKSWTEAIKLGGDKKTLTAKVTSIKSN